MKTNAMTNYKKEWYSKNREKLREFEKTSEFHNYRNTRILFKKKFNKMLESYSQDGRIGLKIREAIQELAILSYIMKDRAEIKAEEWEKLGFELY